MLRREGRIEPIGSPVTALEARFVFFLEQRKGDVQMALRLRNAKKNANISQEQPKAMAWPLSFELRCIVGIKNHPPGGEYGRVEKELLRL